MNKIHESNYAAFISLIGVGECDRADLLLASISISQFVTLTKLESFKKIPNAPLSYWVTEKCRDVFTSHPPLQSDRCTAKQGLATGDDFRFLRLWWEVAASSNISARSNLIQRDSSTRQTDCLAQTQGGGIWAPFAKGGEYSPYYADIPLLVNWGGNGGEIRNFFNETNGRLASRPQNIGYFFKPGLTWPLRTNGLSFRVMPAGCVFSHKGPALFEDTKEKLLSLLALLNTTSVEGIIHGLGVGRVEIQSYEVGTIQSIPTPPIDEEMTILAERACYAAMAMKPHSETGHNFVAPLGQNPQDSLKKAVDTQRLIYSASEKVLRTLQGEMDALAASSYGLNSRDLESLKKLTGIGPARNELDLEDVDSEDVIAGEQVSGDDFFLIAANALCWVLGLVVGRWDIRYATGERQPPPLPDPFDPLPVCPPGMLQNAEGLPAAPADVPADYPLRISWPGIVVEDVTHPEDIVTRVEDALKVIWKERWEAIALEACEILGVKSLREYFRKPAAFFADHLKRYSKSRRQAPIYWPLSTDSGSYILWIYYHRLTPDTLFACVTNFVAPKQEQTERTLARLGAKNPRTAAEEKEYEAAASLIGELATFRAELERLAKIWKPNLNDGVQITAAPLWSLFRLPKWQKTLKETWQELEKGDYDWAHLALSLRPEHVIPKCVKDRSLAIAHGFDEALWEEVSEKKGKKTVTTWKPRKDAAETVSRLVAERTGKA